MKPHHPAALKALGAAALALVTGCTGAAGATSSTGRLESTTITVDAFGAIDTAGLWVAQDEGLFRKAGLTVKLSLPETLVEPQVQDLEDNNAQIASGDYVTFIEDNLLGDPQEHNKKTNLVIVGESSFLQPNVLDVLVPRNGKVNSIAKLAQAKISVLVPNNISDLLVFSLLRDHGISLLPVPPERGGNQHFPDVPFPNIAKAFASGTMQAAFAPEPFVTLYEEGAGVQELADLDQGSTTNFPIQGYVANRTWAQSHPNTLKAFLQALNQGQQIADTNRGEVERVLVKYLQLRPQVADLVALPTFPIGVDATRLQRTVTAMIRFGGAGVFLPKQYSGFKVSSMIYAP